MVLPAVISQVIHVIYNLADTWFVGLTGNPDAVSAVSICMPLYLILTGMSNLFGIGGASVISQALGTRNVSRAKSAFSTAFWCSAIIAVCYSALIFLVHTRLLRVIGGDDRSIGYAVRYTMITIVLGGVPAILSSALSNLIRATGKSRAASFGMTMGAALNILLDPLFMFVWFPKGHEVAGAAAATAVSNAASLLFFLSYIACNRHMELFCLKPDFSSERKRLVLDEARCGIPSFLLLVMAMFSNCFLNPMVASTGNPVMAGLGITRKVDGLAYSVNQGVTQGMLPLVAYCYSSGKRKRMKDVILLSTAITGTFSLLSTALSCAFAPQIIRLFIDDAETIAAGAQFLRTLSLAIPVYSVTFVVIAVFQAMNKTKEPFFLSILHKGSIDIVFMLIIFRHWGGKAAPWGNVASEVIALILALILFAKNCWKELSSAKEPAES